MRSPGPGLVACVIAIVLATAGDLRGQSTTAALLGTVHDEHGSPLAGATVTIASLTTGAEQHTTTDQTGDYRLLGLPGGQYRLTVVLSGFAPESRTDITLSVGQVLWLPTVLRLAGVDEVVVVTAPLVETTRSSLGRILRTDEIERLPVQDRDLRSLARLTPGVLFAGTWIATSGQNARNNQLLVDGVVSDSVQMGLPRATVPIESVGEFTVLTNGFAAEYGGASGAIVSVVTRSGTNAHAGRGYYLQRDEALDARSGGAALAGLEDSRFHQMTVGGFAGGPIRHDRTFYFGSAEQTSTDAERVVQSPTLSLFRPGQGPAFPNSTLSVEAFGRVDGRLSTSQHLSARYRFSRLAQSRYTLENQALVVEERTGDFLRASHDVALTHAWMFWRGAMHELRLQAADLAFRVDDADRCRGCPSEDRPGLLLGRAPSAPQDIAEERWQVASTLTVPLPERAGDHILKFGFDVNVTENDSDFLFNPYGTFTFRTDDPYDPERPTTLPRDFKQGFGASVITLRQQAYALFAQDQWQVRPNVTLHVGARMDRVDGVGLADVTEAAPRLGVAIDPNGRARTAIRGFAGRYFGSAFTQFTRNEALAAGQWTLRLDRPPYQSWTPGTAFQNPLASNPASVVLDTQRVVTRQLPFTDQAGLGVQHAVTPRIVGSVDVTFAKGYRQLMRRDQNYPLNVGQPPLIRPDATRAKVESVESVGHSWYRALLVGVEKRFSRSHAWSAAYTWSTSERTTEGHAFVPQDHRDPGADRGPADSDARHQFAGTASVDLPFGVRLSTLLTARSALPYNVTTRVDATVIDEYPNTDRPPGVGRNAKRGDDFWQVDARLSKTVRLGRSRLELLVEAFNLANHRNWTSFDGVLTSATFGRPLAAEVPRQVQVGARIDF